MNYIADAWLPFLEDSIKESDKCYKAWEKAGYPDVRLNLNWYSSFEESKSPRPMYKHQHMSLSTNYSKRTNSLKGKDLEF
jgi:hypothetical protein